MTLNHLFKLQNIQSDKITPVYFSSVLTEYREILFFIWHGSYLAKRLLAGMETTNDEVVQQITDCYLNHWDESNPNLLTKIVRRYIVKMFSAQIGYSTLLRSINKEIFTTTSAKRFFDSVFGANSILMELAKGRGKSLHWHGYNM